MLQKLKFEKVLQFSIKLLQASRITTQENKKTTLPIETGWFFL
jgi:hypothetical protein